MACQSRGPARPPTWPTVRFSASNRSPIRSRCLALGAKNNHKCVSCLATTPWSQKPARNSRASQAGPQVSSASGRCLLDCSARSRRSLRATSPARSRTPGAGRLQDWRSFDAATNSSPGARVLAPVRARALAALGSSPVVVEMDVSAAPEGARPDPGLLNDALAFSTGGDPQSSVWRFSALPDDAGRLQIRIEGERRKSSRSLSVTLAAPQRRDPGNGSWDTPSERLCASLAHSLALAGASLLRRRWSRSSALIRPWSPSSACAGSPSSRLAAPLASTTLAAFAPAASVSRHRPRCAARSRDRAQAGGRHPPTLALADIDYQAHQLLSFQEGTTHSASTLSTRGHSVTPIPITRSAHCSRYYIPTADAGRRRSATVHAVRGDAVSKRRRRSWSSRSLEPAAPPCMAAAAIAAAVLPEGLAVSSRASRPTSPGLDQLALLVAGILARVPSRR